MYITELEGHLDSWKDVYCLRLLSLTVGKAHTKVLKMQRTIYEVLYLTAQKTFTKNRYTIFQLRDMKVYIICQSITSCSKYQDKYIETSTYIHLHIYIYILFYRSGEAKWRDKNTIKTINEKNQLKICTNNQGRNKTNISKNSTKNQRKYYVNKFTKCSLENMSLPLIGFAVLS